MGEVQAAECAADVTKAEPESPASGRSAETHVKELTVSSECRKINTAQTGGAVNATSTRGRRYHNRYRRRVDSMGSNLRRSAVDKTARLNRRQYLDAKRKAEGRGKPFPYALDEWLARRIPRTHAKTPAERAARQAAARKRFAQSPRGKFKQQKDNADTRGVPWELSYAEWCEIWEASGHWDERGNCADGYVMARHGDEGPYKVGNVRIAPHVENVAERNRLYFASRRWAREYETDDFEHVHSAPGVSGFSGEPGPDVPF